MNDDRTDARTSSTIFSSRATRIWAIVCAAAVAVFYPIASAQTIVSLSGTPAAQVAEILQCQFHVPSTRTVTYSGELDCDKLAKLLDISPRREYQLRLVVSRTQAGQTTGSRLDILGGIVSALTGNWGRVAEAIRVGDANNESTDAVTVRVPVRPNGRATASLGGALNLVVGNELRTIPLGLAITVTHTGGYRPIFQLDISLSSLVRDLVVSGSTANFQIEQSGVIELELINSSAIADMGIIPQKQNTANRTGLRIVVEVE